MNAGDELSLFFSRWHHPYIWTTHALPIGKPLNFTILAVTGLHPKLKQ